MNEIDWIVDYEIPMDIAREELTISRRFRAEWPVLLKTLRRQLFKWGVIEDDRWEFEFDWKRDHLYAVRTLYCGS